VRSAPSPRCGAPWWKKTAWTRCTQAVCSRRRSLCVSSSARHSRTPGRRDPAFRQPTLGQQLPQVSGVGPVGLGVPLTTAGEGGVGRLGDVRRDPGRGRLPGDVPPPGAPLHRERDVVTPGEPRQPAAQVLRSAGATWPRCTCPDTVSR
jgi:hypothetical protein